MGLKIFDEVEEKSKLTAFISGEIDHHSAKDIRKEIDINVERLNPANLYLDFSKVDFMDSSGIGLVMGRYKLLSERGGKVFIQNPPPLIKKVMLVAGLNKLAKIVSVDVPISEIKKDNSDILNPDVSEVSVESISVNVHKNDNTKNASEEVEGNAEKES